MLIRSIDNSKSIGYLDKYEDPILSEGCLYLFMDSLANIDPFCILARRDWNVYYYVVTVFDDDSMHLETSTFSASMTLVQTFNLTSSFAGFDNLIIKWTDEGVYGDTEWNTFGLVRVCL